MTDVAQAAGVSQSTVSMVLNQVPGARLSADTRARVMAAALQLGYRLARRLPAEPALSGAAGRGVIGYLVDEISTSPHPVLSIDGARDAAWAQGCLLQVAVTRNDPAQEAAALDGLLAHPALRGIVYSAIFTRVVRVPARLRGVPTVLLNCHDADKQRSAVVPGEVSGGHAATGHLIRHGHARIAFINGEPWMEAAQDRFKGYRRALAAADLPFDAALVRDGDWMSGSGFDATLALMRLEQPPTAIFCANDLMALGALEALKQLNLRVPQDVSVMGYDDQEIARYAHPPLSTVVLPNYEMGQLAVELLLKKSSAATAVGGGAAADAEPGTALRRTITKIDGPLVQRASVAPPP